MTRPAPEPSALLRERAGASGEAFFVVTGPRGAGKTRWCEALAEAGHAAGLEVGGLLSPAVFSGGGKRAIDLVDLRSQERRRLAEKARRDRPSGAGLGWRFLPETLAWGNEVLRGTGPRDLLVIDELGPLELTHGDGLSAALPLLAARESRLVVVVIRPELLSLAASLWPFAAAILEVTPAR